MDSCPDGSALLIAFVLRLQQSTYICRKGCVIPPPGSLWLRGRVHATLPTHIGSFLNANQMK